MLSQQNVKLFRDLYRRALFIIISLAIYRLGSHITIPGIDVVLLKSTFDSNDEGLLGLFNIFSGGALSRLSLFSLGLMPYISSSIIMNLMTYSVPYLMDLSKEGHVGRRKISQYTRYAAIALALIQSLGIVRLSIAQGLVIIHPYFFTMTTMLTLATGTILCVWLGEQMTEKGIGNGISLLIFAGIACRIPTTVFDFISQLRDGSMSIVTAVMTVIIVFAMVTFVVFFERSIRQVPIQHAKHHMQMRMSGHKPSILPLRLNIAGVLPPIFATSLILFPSTITNMLGNKYPAAQTVQTILMLLYPGKMLYYVLYVIAIFFFSFFYVAMSFNTKEISDNLKRSGGVIPGMRPGIQTQNYITAVVDRLTGVGAVYLCLVTIVPDVLRVFLNIPFAFGGTTLLITVVVMIEMIAQVQALMVPVKYRQMAKTSNQNMSLLR